ncbi:MAG TPA: hypothetical protein VGE37_07605 [Archangium sp.]
MPMYTLIHGGLTVEKTFHPAGSQVELSVEEAKKLNLRGEHVKLTAVIKAEAEAEKKKAEAVAKATAAALAEVEAEAKKTEKKKDGAP